MGFPGILIEMPAWLFAGIAGLFLGLFVGGYLRHRIKVSNRRLLDILLWQLSDCGEVLVTHPTIPIEGLNKINLGYWLSGQAERIRFAVDPSTEIEGLVSMADDLSSTPVWQD